MVRIINKKRTASLFSFILIASVQTFSAVPVLSILPIQSSEQSDIYDKNLLEDLFIAELSHSRWFEIREDRAEKAIQAEKDLQETGLFQESEGKYQRPDADFVSELLLTNQAEGSVLYARAWAADDGSALFSLKKRLTPLTIESDIMALAKDYAFTLTELTGQSAAESSRSLLYLGYYSEAESILHARWLSEGDTQALKEDLKELQKIRIKLIRKELKQRLKEENALRSLFLLNDLSRLEQDEISLNEETTDVLNLIKKKEKETGLELYKATLKAYGNGDIPSGEKNRNRLAVEYIESDAAEKLPILLDEYLKNLSINLAEQAAMSRKTAQRVNDPADVRRFLDRAKDSAASSVLRYPDNRNGIKELIKIGDEEIRLREMEIQSYSKNAKWEEPSQPSKYTFSLGYSRSNFIEPEASSTTKNSDQFGIEASIIRSIPYTGPWAFSVAPGIMIQAGSGTGAGGTSLWKADTFSGLIMADLAIDYYLRYFHIGIGPHIRFGLRRETENWDNNGDSDELVLTSAFGGQFALTAYPYDHLGFGIQARMAVLNRSHHPQQIHREIVFRIVKSL